MEGRVKQSKAAELLGISFRQVQRLSMAGQIPTIISDTGRRFVPLVWLCSQTGEAAGPDHRYANYSRESSSENKASLAR
jgi:predicted site-specific integrase-resolvase